MRHPIGLASFVLTLAACASSSSDAPPEAIVVVSDSLGIPYGVAAISPDGQRLAWARTVDGKSAIFVSSLDGSDARQLTSGVWDSDPKWSPDGRWIAYEAESPGYDVMVVSADGGEPRQLTAGVDRDQPVGWLADGSAVVVLRQGAGGERTMLAPFDGSPVRQLTPNLPGAQNAYPSPDGTMLAFEVHRGDGDRTIWLMDHPGGEPRQLTHDGFEDPETDAMWSPDGRYLVYESRRTGTRDLWIADVTSGELRQLTTDVNDDFSPQWSPDGRHLAFLSNRGGQHDIWVVPAAGGAPARITSDAAIEGRPEWNADGTALYFLRQLDDTELLRFPVEGGEAQTLVAWPGFSIENLDLSPDESSIVFQSARSGRPDLWTVSASGGEPAPFAPSQAGSVFATYSPDGTQVLFLSDRAGTMDLWVAGADGSEPRRLTTGPSAESWMAWSPDGARIAFASDRDVAGADLWVMASTGGEATRLTSGNFRPEWLDWSPDGTQIYFIGDRPGGGRELYRISAGGGAPQGLGATSQVDNSHLSPDGRRLAYSSFEGGWSYIDLLPAAGGAPRRLSDRAEAIFQPFSIWSPDGATLAAMDLDFAANRDAFDILLIEVATGSSRRLTNTPRRNEVPQHFTRDGRELFVVASTTSNEIRKASVGGLLGGPTE